MLNVVLSGFLEIASLVAVKPTPTSVSISYYSAFREKSKGIFLCVRSFIENVFYPSPFTYSS